MKRIAISPRPDWQAQVEALGFGYHTTDVAYWDESAYYSFELDEVVALENATAALWEMCLIAVQYVIDYRLYPLFQIPQIFTRYIEKSWEEDLPSIYGRFDLCYKDGKIKMLEFNADTPTSLFEAGVIQWYWLQDYSPANDQFNSIHEKLVAYWGSIKEYLHPGQLYFSCVDEALEDFTNTAYLQDTAMQAGIQTAFILMESLGWDEVSRQFVDLDGAPVKNLFKLYPWEFMIRESFGSNITRDRNQCLFIEPAWKMILSNKAILPVLWQLFPHHPNLLPAYFEKSELVDYVKKPLLSREGANIEIVARNEKIVSTQGNYGAEGYIYQEFCQLPNFNGNYPVIGSWIIGQEPAGIGIRESDNLVTDNLSRFIPHRVS